MSDLGWNVWGAIASVLGTLGLLPLLLAWFLSRLPSARLPALLDLMKETQDLFSAALREGLITDESDLHQFNVNIWAAMIRVDEVRELVYATNSWQEDVAHWWRGWSGKMAIIANDLNSIRVKLAKRHSKERKRLAAACSPSGLPLPENSKTETSPSLKPTSHGASPCLVLPQEKLFLDGSGRAQDSSRASHPMVRDVVDTPGAGRSRACEPATVDYGDTCDPRAISPRCATHAPSIEVASHHLISDADLKSLLGLALSHSLTHMERGARKKRAMRQDLLLRFGRQLYGGGHVPAWPGTGAMHPKPAHPQSSRLKSLSRLLRRTWDGYPGDGMGWNARTVLEGSVLLVAPEGGGDSDEWVDV
ncbi:hypothetical protein BV20DRAFT_1125212 [Pilatotrama ljubarskyi]|nr:hypothetical protein BV20DRAFT_1125212 [Pilatotrama ljubarskyi]